MTLRVRNWRTFQHYQTRRPPWVKLHRTLLDNFAFIRLPLASQALAPRLWLLASESQDGSLPTDAAELAFRLHSTEVEIVEAVKPLIDGGFLEGLLDASATLATRKRNHAPETERETEAEREIPGPSAPAPLVHVAASWSRQACDDWIDRYGGTAPGGQIGKALKPLVAAHGWPNVRQAWRSYLEQSDAEFASPSRFASTYGRWSGAAPLGSKATVADKTRANLAAWVAEKEGA